MKIIFFLVALFVVVGTYILTPIPSWQNFPPDSLISQEPADTESIYRKAFYTNLTRQEVVNFFFDKRPMSVRINRPPEESYTMVRDQTKSSWLEESTYIWKDRLLINGFYPTKPTEQININGKNYKAKITLRYFPHSMYSSMLVLIFMTLSFVLLNVINKK